MTRLSWLFAASLLTACLHPTAVEYSGPVRVKSTELIPINPDVKVVADSDKPMVFARGSYWMFHDAAWYRAASIHGTWSKVEKPPLPLVQLDQPYALVHYRDDHPADQTATAEVDNNANPTVKREPTFDFKQNPLAFEN
jgi:hypothetical protein